MEIKDYGKLVKLTIKNTSMNETFTVMFNPEAYTETFSNVYRKQEDINTGLEKYVYVKTLPQDIKLKIILDGTGVTNYYSTIFPVFKNAETSVYEKVNEFLKLAWYPEEGRAKPLLIEWGDFSYHCFLKDVTINYTLFDRKGHPLRAELDAVFVSNPEQITHQLKSRFELKSSRNKTGATSSTDLGSAPNSNAQGKEEKTGGFSPGVKTSNGIVISVS